MANPLHYSLDSGVLHTRLTREYGVRYPFVNAGMAFIGLPPLAIAVSNAGGLGMLGAAPEPPPITQVRLQALKAGTSKPFGVDFLVASSGPQAFTTREHIDVCLTEGVKLVVFHWSLPPREWVDALHAAGARVWMQVDSLELARQALALGVDGLVAQGHQAGGHTRATQPTSRLVRQVREEAGSVLLLAAGGIADGASAARALHQGADGVWVGTRMVASEEAYAHPGYKQRLVEGGEDDSRLTTLFGPEWAGQPQRVLRNRVVREWEGREDRLPTPPPPPATIGTTKLFPGVANAPYTMPKFCAFVPTPDTEGDLEEMDMPASGASMARIQSLLPAGRIVTGMMDQARELLAHPERLGDED